MPTNNGTVRIGPWGGEDERRWNYTVKGDLSRISITCDDNVINSISFISRDKNGNVDLSPTFGTPAGTLKEINIDPSVEKLVLMEGIVDRYGDSQLIVVRGLSFTTIKNGVTTQHGPYGHQPKIRYYAKYCFSCLLSKDPFTGFHGYHGTFLNSIGANVLVLPRTPDLYRSEGGPGGAPFSYITQGVISHISISYGDVVRAIRFTSLHAGGRLELSDTIGDSDPKHKYHEIEIDTKTENLSRISGTVGTYDNSTLITSLSFWTNNQRMFGPFGTQIGQHFSSVIDAEAYKIAGFYGRAGSLIDAIGLYRLPRELGPNRVRVGPAGGTGSNELEYRPKGLISRISITYGVRVLSVRFESTDEVGNVDSSAVYGKETDGYKRYEINIDTKVEKLNGISGQYDRTNGILFLLSVGFSTDKKIEYGPFGTMNSGTYFSIPIKDGYISGIYGENINGDRAFVNYIGAFVNST